MNKKTIGFTSISIFIILALIVLINPQTLTLFDLHITNTVYNSVPSITPIIKIITTLGNVNTVTIIVAVISIILVINKKWSLTLFLIINECLVAAINHYIKFFFARPRPTVEHLVSASGYSFPSGHSAATMALCLSLFFIIKMIYGKDKKWLQIIILFIPFVIAFTRIYLGVHYFSDVLAGLSYSTAVTIFIHQFFQKKQPN